MQLIDALEQRADEVKILENSKVVTVTHLGLWSVNVDGASYDITDEAFGVLLNILRVPIKHIGRLVDAYDSDGVQIAEDTINFWLRSSEGIGFLLDDKRVITQVFEGKCLYFPGVKINDLVLELMEEGTILDSWESSGGSYHAVYVSSLSHVVMGKKRYRKGIRVLFSDCFSFTPRFDAVLIDNKDRYIAWPVEGRKFRVASNTISQVVEQVEDFIAVSLSGMNSKLVPRVERAANESVDIFDYVGRLCSELRLNQRVRSELEEHLEEQVGVEAMCFDTVMALSTFESRHVGMEVIRDIQVAGSFDLVYGSFK